MTTVATEEVFITEMQAVTDRSCGDCSMCCKLLSIDKPELTKPAGKWCQHCRPGQGGCLIYKQRPHICRTFSCQWLIDPQMGDDWWPKRSHIIVTWERDVIGSAFLRFTVDPIVPNRWREKPYYYAIKELARRGLRSDYGFIFRTNVIVANRTWIIMPAEDVEITDLGDGGWKDKEKSRPIAEAFMRYVDGLSETERERLVRYLDAVQLVERDQ